MAVTKGGKNQIRRKISVGNPGCMRNHRPALWDAILYRILSSVVDSKEIFISLYTKRDVLMSSRNLKNKMFMSTSLNSENNLTSCPCDREIFLIIHSPDHCSQELPIIILDSLAFTCKHYFQNSSKSYKGVLKRQYITVLFTVSVNIQAAAAAKV
ncbi:hypothetical protein STEG23_001001 [Scotinomys teguina]